MSRPTDEATERRLASRELGQAQRKILAIRNFYIANAILWGFPMLFSLLLPWFLLKALFVGGFVLMITGAVRVRQSPFVWSILIAAIWTVVVVGWIGFGFEVASIRFALAAIWTVGCWLMLPATVRVKALIARHPDLWISKRMQPGGRRRRTGKRP